MPEGTILECLACYQKAQHSLRCFIRFRAMSKGVQNEMVFSDVNSDGLRAMMIWFLPTVTIFN